MAKVIVYDEYTNRLFTYNLSENDPMPYAYGNTMRVREFRCSSNSPTPVSYTHLDVYKRQILFPMKSFLLFKVFRQRLIPSGLMWRCLQQYIFGTKDIRLPAEYR